MNVRCVIAAAAAFAVAAPTMAQAQTSGSTSPSAGSPSAGVSGARPGVGQTSPNITSGQSNLPKPSGRETPGSEGTTSGSTVAPGLERPPPMAPAGPAPGTP